METVHSTLIRVAWWRDSVCENVRGVACICVSL
jgi:hypothetical protein